METNISTRIDITENNKRTIIKDLYLLDQINFPTETIEVSHDEGAYSADVKLYRYFNGDEKALAVQGNIKWDGCANLEFCDNDESGDCSTVHICGVLAWRNFSMAVEEVFKAAFEVMGDIASEGASEFKWADKLKEIK